LGIHSSTHDCFPDDSKDDGDPQPDLEERGMSAFVEFRINPDDLDPILDRMDEERQRIYETDA
jgi:hypothetical protein